MRKLTIIFILLSINLWGQQSSLSRGVNYLSEYIASDYFKQIGDSVNDLQLVDSLFEKAVNYYSGDCEEALLALTFACVPYKKVPIQLPLFNIILQFPLTSHNDSVFNRKNSQLPSKLYFDTPSDDYGDRDKLAHFFGSAFISYKSNIFDLGDLIGYFVEVFEENFKVQSHIDYRDMETNKLGNIFGEGLKHNKKLLPSRILLIPAFNNLRYGL
jgi:hypothetical protein